MKTAFIFPGQGSQFVGMGKDLADSFVIAKHLFQEVDDALNQNLSKIIFEGPMEELTLTFNAQPALMAVSMAIIKILQYELKFKLDKYCDFVAGHSLGEYSALAASDALSTTDTAKLLRIRGAAMQEAVPAGQGSMAAILGLTIEEVKKIVQQAKQGYICDIANDNCEGQIVISGHNYAIDKAIEICAAQGKKAIKLPVSAPFHSQLMLPAQGIMIEALAETKILPPAVPLVANVIAEAVEDGNVIRELLEQQVTEMVRWHESIIYMHQNGVRNMFEIGAGKVLTNMNKRINKEIKTTSIQTPHDIEEFANNLIKN